MKKGLVMEGGAMRGMFTSGVIDVFMENDIEFDGAIGVSAGATFGCNIKSKQIGRAIRYNTKYCHDYRFGSFKSFMKSGDFFDVDFCYNEIPFKLDIFDTKTFTENPLDFYVVATNVLTGKPEYHKCYDGLDEDLQWIQASASIPIISKIVRIGKKLLLDGGIADSVPIKYFQSLGYDKNVVVLTRSYEFVKKKSKLSPLCAIKYKRFPEFVKTFTTRQDMYNATYDYIKAEEAKKNIFVIKPAKELDLSSAEKDVNKLRKAYEEGRKAALEAINERNLKEYLEMSN